MKYNPCPAAKKFPRGKKDRALLIHTLLKKRYPEAQCALDFQNDPFRLLVMARLFTKAKPEIVPLKRNVERVENIYSELT